MPIAIGTAAPDFTLKNTQMEEVKLSSFKGKKNVVLLFFPLAFTSVCTEEMCWVTGDFPSFEKMNAEVFGVSVDSPFAQKAWAEKNGIKIPLLSDFNREVCTKYGAVYDQLLGFKGVAKRSAFVVDKTGTIRYAWVSEDAKVKPSFEEIKKTLGGLK